MHPRKQNEGMFGVSDAYLLDSSKLISRNASTLREIFPMKRCCLGEWEVNSGAIEFARRSNAGLTEHNIPNSTAFATSLENSSKAEGMRFFMTFTYLK